MCAVFAPSLMERGDRAFNPSIRGVYRALLPALAEFGVSAAVGLEAAGLLEPSQERRILVAARRRGAGLLHGFGFVSPRDAAFLFRLARLSGLRYVLSSQGLPEQSLPMRTDLEPLTISLYARAARVTVLSVEHGRRLLGQVPGLAAERIAVVSNGVDYGFYSRRPRLRPETPGRPLVVCAARQRAYKGPDLLLFAFADLLSRGARADLVLCGDDESGGHYRRLAAALGLGPRARFLGQVPRRTLRALLWRARCAVLPSRFEPFGLFGLEAMAAGTALVLSRGAGLAERLGDGREAVLVEPGDVGSLSRAIEAVLEDDALLGSLEREGPEFAKKLSWGAAAAEYARVYAEATESTPGSVF